jgi:hypothetical protein
MVEANPTAKEVFSTYTEKFLKKFIGFLWFCRAPAFVLPPAKPRKSVITQHAMAFLPSATSEKQWIFRPSY